MKKKEIVKLFDEVLAELLEEGLRLISELGYGDKAGEGRRAPRKKLQHIRRDY